MKGTIVLIPATLAGMGQTSSCEVLVRKQTNIVQGAISQISHSYSDCSIIGAPANLPDGEYTVSFDGFSMKVTCHHGHWLSHGQARKDSPAGAGGLSRAS